MNSPLTNTLELIRSSITWFAPELVLGAGILLTLTIGLFRRVGRNSFHILSFSIFIAGFVTVISQWTSLSSPLSIFTNMIQADQFGAYFKILFMVAGIVTVVMTWLRNDQERISEYYALILSISLGANLLASSTNFAITFLALELISIPSYILTGFSFSRNGTEGALKYFIFGSISSAVMLYGISLLYGITGTLEFAGNDFKQIIAGENSSVFIIGSLFTLGGFLFKVAASPLHPWAPDVYEASPMPIVAFFSSVPKLAGVAVLARFIAAINVSGHHPYYWQMILAGVSILTLTIGNFSALWQKSPKRMMAYSSIAQTGFMLVGLVVFPELGLENLLFYATVFVLLNSVVFLYLSYFETSLHLTDMPGYAGIGQKHLWPSVLVLIAFIGLTGLPPTAGFTSKLLIFSGLWQAYTLSEKTILLVLLIFGLLNTVVSLFYYLRIPYYSFIKPGANVTSGKILTWENLFGGILVLVILLLFFSPGLLMGWINKINFVF